MSTTPTNIPPKYRVQDINRYQDQVERYTRMLREATAKRDASIRDLARSGLTHDQIVHKMKDRLTRGRIGQIAEPKRMRVDLEKVTDAGAHAA